MRRLILSVGLATVACLGFGAAFVLAGSKAGSPTTSTVSDSAATGDFTYDGQTIPYSSWASDMGNASGGKLVYVTTPFSFDCASGSLTVSAKKVFESLNPITDYTFTVGAGSDPAVPDGSVIVGVAIHSGNEFSVNSSEWVSDGSRVKITLDHGFSNAKVFYCTPVGGTTTETTTTTVTTETSESVTTITTTVPTTVTVPNTTVTLPAETVTNVNTVTVTTPASTVTLPESTTVINLPPPLGSTTTVTLAGKTVTLPISTVIKRIVGTFTPPRRIVRVPAHVIRVVHVHRVVVRFPVRRIVVRKVIRIVIHVRPTGTGPSSGVKGSQTGIGKG